MQEIINNLFKLDRYLLGKGYNEALAYIFKKIPLEIGMVKSGTKLGDWVVPPEWIIRDGWVKFKGEKILDYKVNPMCVANYSAPVNKTVSLEELKKHLMVSDECPDAYSYSYKFYEREWGFTMPRNQLQEHVIYEIGCSKCALKKSSFTNQSCLQPTDFNHIWKDILVCENGICVPELKNIDPTVGKVIIEGMDTSPKFVDILKEGDYEVFIDSEFKTGVLKYGVHTIKGKGKKPREILLFAHLDHPYQANDNLSGVACLIDMADRLHDAFFKHTIKIIFCAETIGSTAYALKEDISKVDFVIALDCVGNNNNLLWQKSYDKYARINYITHLAVTGEGKDHRKGEFRLIAGSDEYYFNDPLVGIPGIMLSRLPYNEYHTSEDTPDKINYDKIKEVQDVIMKIIEIYEKDFIPKRKTKGVLMRSKHDIQTDNKLLNRDLDYLWYEIDDKKYLSEIIIGLGMGFDYTYSIMEKLLQDKMISK